jgi:hypothetical protein
MPVLSLLAQCAGIGLQVYGNVTSKHVNLLGFVRLRGENNGITFGFHNFCPYVGRRVSGESR